MLNTVGSPPTDTIGAEGSVIVSEVSSFYRLKCKQECLGWEKVSCLGRCPHGLGSTVCTKLG